MPKFVVSVALTVFKNYLVEADCEDDAWDEAKEVGEFSPTDEPDTHEVISVDEATAEDVAAYADEPAQSDSQSEHEALMAGAEALHQLSKDGDASEALDLTDSELSRLSEILFKLAGAK